MTSPGGEATKLIYASEFLWRTMFGLALIASALPSVQAQDLRVKKTDYPTLDNPTTAVATNDGRYVFVSVTIVGSPNFSGPDSAAGSRKDIVSGIEVFRGAGVHHSKLKPIGFIPIGSTGANGLALLRDGKTLAVGAGTQVLRFLAPRM